MDQRDSEKNSELGRYRSDRHKRLYKKALAKSRVRDFTLVSLIGIGSVIWTGTEKFNTYLHDHILSLPEIVQFDYRLKEHERIHKGITETLADHERRLRELESK